MMIWWVRDTFGCTEIFTLCQPVSSKPTSRNEGSPSLTGYSYAIRWCAKGINNSSQRSFISSSCCYLLWTKFLLTRLGVHWSLDTSPQCACISFFCMLNLTEVTTPLYKAHVTVALCPSWKVAQVCISRFIQREQRPSRKNRHKQPIQSVSIYSPLLKKTSLQNNQSC